MVYVLYLFIAYLLSLPPKSYQRTALYIYFTRCKSGDETQIGEMGLACSKDDRTNIRFLDITKRPVYLKHRPVYISKHNVSETGFCLRLQVKPTQLAQSVELVSISGHLFSTKIGCTSQSHHKSASDKTKH
jgi:hypothetical protein